MDTHGYVLDISIKHGKDETVYEVTQTPTLESSQIP